jgi:enamine deaminase RidA (YjgF/YER057c/UK114 family)
MCATVNNRLSEQGLILPEPPPPVADYLPFTKEGRILQVSGVAPTENGAYAVVGKVGRELDLEDGRRAARICALNLLSVINMACYGELDRVRRFFMIRGFVNATEDFEAVPDVINGAADLIISVFGAAIGAHARTSVGCATLPGRVAVEVDALILIDEIRA